MFLAINLWARRESRVAALIKCESWLHRSNSTLLHADTRATKPCRDSPLKEACNLPVEEKDGYMCGQGSLRHFCSCSNNNDSWMAYRDFLTSHRVRDVQLSTPPCVLEVTDALQQLT